MLTAFPPPHRAPPTVVDRWLDDRFAGVLTPPEPEALRHLVRSLASAGFIGGATYDALVAITAAHADAVLVTADTRALSVYDFIGVEVRYLVVP